MTPIEAVANTIALKIAATGCAAIRRDWTEAEADAEAQRELDGCFMVRRGEKCECRESSSHAAKATVRALASHFQKRGALVIGNALTAILAEGE